MFGQWGDPRISRSISWSSDLPYAISMLPNTGEFVGSEDLSSTALGGSVVDLCSSSKKLLIKVNSAFFHMMVDTLSVALNEVQRDPSVDVVFLVPSSEIALKIGSTDSVLSEFSRLLTSKYGTSCVTQVVGPGDSVLVNNFDCILDASGSMECLLNLVEFFIDSDLVVVDLPYSEKVYLSRRRTISNQDLPEELGRLYEDPSIRKKYEYTTNDRIDDEKLLEDYFSGLGYAIVCPEDFVSFSDQVRFFSRVRSLVSVTSAGLTNAIFMPAGSTLVELTTPLVVNHGDGLQVKAIHPFYQILSVLNGHTYISIPHDRVASSVVNRIDANSQLKSLLSGI